MKIYIAHAWQCAVNGDPHWESWDNLASYQDVYNTPAYETHGYMGTCKLLNVEILNPDTTDFCVYTISKPTGDNRSSDWSGGLPVSQVETTEIHVYGQTITWHYGGTMEVR